MTLQIVLLALLVAGALVKALELVRDPDDRILSGVLVACLALLACGQFCSIPPVTAHIDAMVAVGSGKIVYNVLTMAGLYALLCFFTLAVREHRAAVRRVRLDAVLVLVAAAALVVLIVVTPSAYRGHTLTSPYLGYPTVAAFYVVGGAYFVYAYVVGAMSLWRYARGCRGSVGLALRVLGAGLAGLTLVSAVRVLRVLVVAGGGPALDGLNAANFELNNVSFILVVVGLFVVGLAQVAAAVRERAALRRTYRELGPLWELLRASCPGLVLEPAGRAAFTTRRACLRRIIECRDGLVLLAPLIVQAAGDRDAGAASPAEMAGFLRTAVLLRSTDRGSAPGPEPVALAVPDASGFEADAEELVALSAALSAAPSTAPRGER